MQTKRLASQGHHMYVLCLSVGRGDQQKTKRKNTKTSLINVLFLPVGFMSSRHLVPLGVIANLLRKTVFREIIRFSFIFL